MIILNVKLTDYSIVDVRTNRLFYIRFRENYIILEICEQNLMSKLSKLTKEVMDNEIDLIS